MTCRQLITEFLAEYLEGALPSETRQKFDEHLAICPDCVAYVDNYRRTVELARAAEESTARLADQAPPALVQAILKARRSLG